MEAHPPPTIATFIGFDANDASPFDQINRAVKTIQQRYAYVKPPRAHIY